MKCYHRYLKNSKINLQPPGFADFIRGTRTLALLSKKYNYNLLIDRNSHPLFQHFLFDENVYSSDVSNDIETSEFIPPLNYTSIYQDIEKMFQSGQELYLMTNSYHSGHEISSNFTQADISESHNYIKRMLTLSEDNQNLLDQKLSKMNILNENYLLIHLRFFDQCLFNTSFGISQQTVNNIIQLISKAEQEYENIVISSNWSDFVKFLKQLKPNIKSTDSKVIHTGSLNKKLACEMGHSMYSQFDSNEVDDEMILKLRDTSLDLKIISNSKKVYCASQYGASGFSELISEIYDIEYQNISSLIFN